MDLLKKADLSQIITSASGWCISIYMPSHKVGREQQQDPIRLENLIVKAEERLLEHGLRRPEVQVLTRPAEILLTDYEGFWQHQSDGLSIFLCDGFFKFLRLPLKFEELVVVAGSFHVKPLLPLFSKDGPFYILAISMNEIRLLLGTRYTVEEVELTGVPTSMEEALWMDDPEKFTGFHTSASSPGRGGERRAMFHGHGAKQEENKTNLLRYFQYVDAGLNDLLENKDIPLVLAGVDYLLPIYREANTYPRLLEEELEGNPDDLKKGNLHRSAWKLVEPLFEEAQNKDIQRFEQFYGQRNKLASTDLKSVLKAAQFGQVETLFVPLGVQKWGRYDPGKDQITIAREHERENEDLLDYAARQTILNAGQVYAVQPENMPGEEDLAAILRYAV